MSETADGFRRGVAARWILFAAALTGAALTAGHAQESGPDYRTARDIEGLISRIAFGSCSDQERPQEVLRAVVARKPELFIYLGDNIYGDTRDMSVLRSKYTQLGARPEFQLLRSAVPVAAIWDDHDYGENDAGKEYPFKEESKEIFLEFWGEPKESERRSRPGIYAAHLFRDEAKRRALQVILLDTRTFRDPLAHNRIPSWKNDYHPDPNPEKTLLGEEQWKWLEEQLQVEADLRVIATSIQFAHEYNGWESWTNLPSELEKMIESIRNARAGGVLFISGDVHWGEISVLRAPGLYPLHDVTSSGINQDWPSVEPNRNRFGEVVRDYNFGMIEVDWAPEDPAVELRVHDGSGEARVKLGIRLSELQFEE
ncbi:MAG TPA: alkaline phosphatase D family protein [Verrucomicrobiales bacterium]|nr:alkaline phosphatase D family protein [Verrucomicrobiales bacterium]